MIQKETHHYLLSKSLSIKKRFLKMYKDANAGHIGSSLSCADMIAFLFFDWMNDEDEFVLSKGHAAACLYSVLAEKGIISEAEIQTFYKNDTYLAAHPPAGKIDKISFATGSLGHGLSLAAGFGLAKKLKQHNDKTFCVTSDGELNEGSTWEAAQFIHHHNLKNVVWLIDKNNLQGFGKTEEVMNPLSLKEKCTAFGFHVMEADGHDFVSLAKAKQAVLAANQPCVIICNTIKGKDWLGLENTLDCHYLPFKENQFNEIIEALENVYQQKMMD
jgi:transketolase